MTSAELPQVAERDLNSVAFPKLSDEQIAALAQCSGATVRKFRDGDALFHAGERDTKFFVVISGEVEIIDPSGDQPRTVTVHKHGNFTGDVSHLTGNPTVVTGMARGGCEVLEISGETLRHVINQCPAHGDTILQAFIARRQLMRDSGAFTGPRVIGSRYSHDTFRIRDFLFKNRVMFTWIDLESDPDVDRLLRRFGVTEADTPIVSCSRGMLRNPTNRELAEAIGIRRPLEQVVYDMAVVGSGPAGLAAAVYGASEGLNTVVLERLAPGGQAGSSMRIENYLGFPLGLTGSELADRAVLQANRFGARLSVATPVVALAFENGYPVLQLDGGESLVAKSLLIATGAQYRRLEVEGCERFEGSGVYYAATFNESQACLGADVVVVGGGNSAGQAVVFLSAYARKVHLVIRGASIDQGMSSYLARRIEQTPNVEVIVQTVVNAMRGDRALAAVDLAHRKTGELRTIHTPALFSFIGAVPHTDWLPPEIERDSRSFVQTGAAVANSPHWTERRAPLLLETSHPGVFATGDVRAGSVKRVASAVGEGAMAVQFVHEFLKGK